MNIDPGLLAGILAVAAFAFYLGLSIGIQVQRNRIQRFWKENNRKLRTPTTIKPQNFSPPGQGWPPLVRPLPDPPKAPEPPERPEDEREPPQT